MKTRTLKRSLVNAFTRDLVARPQNVRKVAKRHGLRVKYVSSGAARAVFRIVGTNMVLKWDKHDEQSSDELRNILRLRSKPKFKKYIPKIYLYGCKIGVNAAVITMRYYPKRCNGKDHDFLEEVFANTTITDIYYGNMRKTAGGIPKLVDLGV